MLEQRRGAVVPGGRPLTDPTTGRILTDVKGRPLWDKAKPTGHRRQFISAGKKRRFLAGEISADKAFVEVPYYRGIPIDAYRQLMKDRTYAEKRRTRQLMNDTMINRLARSVGISEGEHN